MTDLHSFVSQLFSDVPHGIISSDEECLINVRIPESYSQAPDRVICDHTPPHHTLFDLEAQKEHFKDIRTDCMRIHIINGMPTNPDDMDCMYCDYCTSSISDDYRFCNECQKDMCHLCYGETSEEIAIANSSKNWQDRKDALQACRDGHTLIIRKLNGDSSPTYCYYRASPDCKVGHYITGEWYRSSEGYEDGSTKDVCIPCSQTEEYKNNPFKEVKKMGPPDIPMNYARFGSMLDWVPVLKDKEYDIVLLNLNPKSPYHNQICLASCDDHGRMGFYTLPHDHTLEKLLRTLSEHQEKHAEKFKDQSASWDEFYDEPIKQYMSDLNMQIHYG